MIDGCKFSHDDIAGELGEIEASDTLEHVHARMTAWWRMKPKEREQAGLPFEREVVDWYDDLRDEAGESDGSDFDGSASLAALGDLEIVNG